ncbi:transposase [Marinicella pacifica]|uniref:Transposase n=1 Tax=Marinicella pacifica TaxID=1171543 RepID=A0A917CXH2_9GAMM|nr:transposase [Marinicella pacifica]GGG02382.1 transposase [Marinicella pacifica]
MTVARSQQICVEDTPYYHIVSRCVRRAFLCGEDTLTGRSFEHRRQWLIDRIKKVSSVFAVFAIDVCSYAIMSNHFHLVLKIGANDNWTDKQVLITWQSLYSLPVMCQRYLQGDDLDNSSVRLVQKYASEYRERLCSISWFMKAINEYIARMANEEDRCTGHFWESRFKSQALLDERALLTCMAYVDLNPIRACMAKSLSDSEFTSIKERIEAQSTDLLPFGKGDNDLPYYLSSYIDLVDETGRVIRDDKAGYISHKLGSALTELELNPDTWIDELKGFKSVGFSAVGTVNQLKEYSHKTKRKWSVGIQLKPALE